MPTLMLDALNFLQAAIVVGFICWMDATSFPVREWQQLPMIQRQRRTYSARRWRFVAIYRRTLLAILAVATLALLALAGVASFVAVASPHWRPATLAEMNDAMQTVIILVALQFYVLVMFFIRLWRNRRALRVMARKELAFLEVTGAADEASGAGRLVSRQMSQEHAAPDMP